MEKYLTDWDYILERFGYNTNALAHAIIDGGFVPPKKLQRHIRVDLDNFRYTPYSPAVKYLLEMSDKAIERYTAEYPSLVKSVDIELAVNAIIRALQNDASLTKEDIGTLLSAEESIARLVELVFKKMGANQEWIRTLRGTDGTKAQQ